LTIGVDDRVIGVYLDLAQNAKANPEMLLTLFKSLRALGLSACVLALVSATASAQTKADSQPVRTESGAQQVPDLIGDLILTSFSEVKAGLPNVDWTLVARMYHIGNRGVGGRDSLGCQVVPLRTVAVDPKLVPRRTILFIPQTIGLPVPVGGTHDGYWYASDTGGGIKGAMIDLFTGHGARSMTPLMQQGLNLANLATSKVGEFNGCPPAWPQNGR
jgi:3D (Asp-Asp-Asp) domain-containing protein